MKALSATAPQTVRKATTDTLHGIEIADPYQWLEDAEQPVVQQWVVQQEQFARQALDSLPNRHAFEQHLQRLMYRASLSVPVERGGCLFFERRAEHQEKAVLMVCETDGTERVLIDPLTLSPEANTALGAWYPSHDGRFLAYAQRENNADEATLYIRNVQTGQDLSGEVIEGAKYASASWTPNNEGFYYEWLPTGTGIPIAERPGHTQLRFHKLGTSPREDRIIYPATGNPECFLGSTLSHDGRFLQVVIQHGWSRSDHYLCDLQASVDNKQAPFIPLVRGKDARFSITWWAGHFYILTNYGAPRYRVMRTTADLPPIEQWEQLLPESEHSLESLQIIGDKLAIGSLIDAASRLRIFSLKGEFEREVSLSGLGSASALYGCPDSSRAYFSFSSFGTPKQVLQLSVGSSADSSINTAPKPWRDDGANAISGTNLQVTQTWFHSRDGTRISLFLLHQKNIRLDGSHPTLLYGYGGFNVSLTPSFSPLATAWVEKGGVYAVANLRGGGEYGEAWHRAGMCENKQNVFDDFIAAAEYLVEKKYTRPDSLGIYGGSNGGLLVGASMCQRPDLFAAVVCAVPLLDMLRYHLFGSGKTWIGEYGCADSAQDFEWLQAYSPYHALSEAKAYPALLMMAADSDDRVDPLHARKFVAAVQWCNQQRAALQPDGTRPTAPALFRLEKNAGHGGADKVQERVASCTDICSFLWDQLS